MFVAIATGTDVNTVRVFLNNHGVDVNARNADGATLAYIAAAHGHRAVLEVLVDQGGADVGKATPDDAKLLLLESWRLDSPSQEVLARTDGGTCPLYIAVRNGRVDTVRALIKRGGRREPDQDELCHSADRGRK